MTSQINPNILTTINNPFMGKILFYTKKSTTDIWHETIELFTYAKRLLRFFKIKKHLPGYGLKLKRTSLNNIYIFNFFPEHARQPNKILKMLNRYRFSRTKLGFSKTRRIQHLRKKNIKNKTIRKLRIVKKILKKKTKPFKNVTFDKQINKFTKTQNKQFLNHLIKTKFIFQSIIKHKKNNFNFRRKKYIKISQFQKIRQKIILNFLNKLKKKTFNFIDFKTLLIKIFKSLKLKHLYNENKLEKFFNVFSKKYNFNFFLRTYSSLIYKRQSFTKLKKSFHDKTKSKFYKRNNKYRSDLKSSKYFEIIKNNFFNLSDTFLKTKPYFYSSYNIKNSNLNFFNFTKIFKKLLKIQNKKIIYSTTHSLMSSFPLLKKNINQTKHTLINQYFLYGFLLNNRLNLYDKITLFENECRFTFNIKYSTLKLIYQKMISLMPKVINTFQNVLNEEDLPFSRNNYSKLHKLLDQGIRSQNFQHFQEGLNRFLRRQNTRRLFLATNEIIQVVEKILHEQYLYNLFIFSKFLNINNNNTTSPIRFTQPYEFIKKIPYSLTLKYRGKLKKAGRKQRSVFFLKNPFLNDNLNLLKTSNILTSKLKYETISSRFGAHFRRGGTGGFNFSITYIYS